MSAVVEFVAPARLGPGFRRLLASSWLSNLGDGLQIAAGPLLVAELTRNPMLVSTALLVQRLPWMLFALYAGAVADRHDRRRIVVAADSVRGLVIAALAVAILTDGIMIWPTLVALFVLGTCETFADIATGTLLPMVVDDTELGLANARITFGMQAINQLAGPALGAVLFGVAIAAPFVTQAVLVLAAARLMAGMRVRREPPAAARRSSRRDIAEGMRWLWHNGPMRTLTLTILTFNVTFGAAWAVLVLYALERLGLSSVIYGLFAATAAVGSLVGVALYVPTERWLGAANIMRVGLLIETATHLTFALTGSPAVAFVAMFAFGAHAGMWMVTSTTARQRRVPLELQGRVGAVYGLAMQGGLVVGTPIGGLLAGRWGIAAPYWFAFAGSALVLVLIWRELAEIAATPDRTR